MISAIILAAGRSLRMGQPKMVMPWGNTTIIGKVIETLHSAGIKDKLVVTGQDHDKIERALQKTDARLIFNPDHLAGGMLQSLQVGLQAQLPETSAVLVCLGDQPQIEKVCVEGICSAFEDREGSIIVPSYQMHRGHPWLVEKSHWSELLQMAPQKSPRDFLEANSKLIDYVNISSPTIIADVDTFNEYLKYRP